MDRRGFVGALAVGLLAASRARAEAQESRKVVQIGWLDPSQTPAAGTQSRALTSFRQRLRELGYVEGRDVVIESRFADTYWDRLPGQARDLVARRVDVIVTIGTATVMVAKKATTTIPIVLAGAGEPLELGLVPSLAHPGATRSSRALNRVISRSRSRPSSSWSSTSRLRRRSV
jgi:putative ABC transport system substrate-binding protein